MASNSSHHNVKTTTITTLPLDVIETHILTKFDGPSLAATASTSHLLHTLCNKQKLWEDICNSTWNSIKHPLVQNTISAFPGGHRSFFSYAFPLVGPDHHSGRSHRHQGHITELISAVDICYGGDQVYSKVMVTNTDNRRFLKFSFWVDLLDRKETLKVALKYEGDDKKCMLELEKKLTLSWILIDPNAKRALNLSSLRPVSVRPCWDGSDIEVIYATILRDSSSEFVECRVVATFVCDEEEKDYLEMREVSLFMEDMGMMPLNGEKCLRILEEAMERGKRKKANGGEEKEMYVKYMCLKRKMIKGDNKWKEMYNTIMQGVVYFVVLVFFFFCVIQTMCFS